MHLSEGPWLSPIQRPLTAAVWTVIHRPLTASVWTVYKFETWENTKQSLVFAFGGVGRGKKTQCILLVFWLAFRGVRPADQLLVVRMLERGRSFCFPLWVLSESTGCRLGHPAIHLPQPRPASIDLQRSVSTMRFLWEIPFQNGENTARSGLATSPEPRNSSCKLHQ